MLTGAGSRPRSRRSGLRPSSGVANGCSEWIDMPPLQPSGTPVGKGVGKGIGNGVGKGIGKGWRGRRAR